MRKAIYPGSFDPITNGHMDIIGRASRLFDTVYVCVAQNLNKVPYFTLEERVAMVKEACQELPNVEVIATEALVVETARRVGATAIVRGLRAVTDFEYEFQLAAANEYMDKNIETVFLTASAGKGFISSSTIKEFRRFGTEIRPLVPPCVIAYFEKKERE